MISNRAIYCHGCSNRSPNKKKAAAVSNISVEPDHIPFIHKMLFVAKLLSRKNITPIYPIPPLIRPSWF